MILGIDPGLSGAWALLSDRGEFLGCDELPVIRDQGTAWIDGPALRDHILQAAAPNAVALNITAWVERVAAMPKQGVSSVFTFGMGFGSILPTLQQLPAAIRFVTPAVWKKSLSLSRDKAESLDRARLLFPMVGLTRKKDHGMAEALLIAHYGLNQVQRRAAA